LATLSRQSDQPTAPIPADINAQKKTAARDTNPVGAARRLGLPYRQHRTQ